MRWSERRRRRLQTRDDEAGYRDRLEAATARIEAAVDAEDAALRESWPDPHGVLRTATVPRVELWQRRPTDPDWLYLRFGLVDRTAAVTVTGPRPAGWTEPVVRRAAFRGVRRRAARRTTR